MNARLPGWEDLHYFLATARGGTLAAAAEDLGVNASTVQRRINRLEEDLQARVFDRSQRGYALTPAGEELLAHAAAMELEVLAVGRKVGGFDERLAGTIRVATVDDLAVTVLMPLVREFTDAHPGVTVEVIVQVEFADLARRQADVALRLGGKPREPDLITRFVSRVNVALYASPAYLDARGRPRSIEELAAHDIVRGDDRVSGLLMERLIDRHGGRVSYRSNAFLARAAALRDGLGIGFMSCFLADPDPALERLDVELPAFPGGSLWMLVHADLRRNARVRAFVDHVYAGLVAQRDRFEGVLDREA